MARMVDAAEYAGKRQAGCDPLGYGQNVWHHAVMLQRKPLAGAAKTGLDFIEDQEDAVPICKRPQPFHERRRRNDIAAFAQDGFNQDGCRFLRRGLRSQKQLELLEGERAGRLFGQTKLIRIWEWGDKYTRRQRAEAGPIDRFGCRESHRTGRPAVE
jgi:hypothetical protein